MALSEGINPRTPEERIPVTLRPSTNAPVLNGPKTTDNATLYRLDGGVVPRIMPGHILSRVEQFEEFVSQLGPHILSASADREKIMTVTLIPESLGKVVLNCREQGGRLWVEIQAASQSVREILQRQEEGIRQMMDQSGYALMQFDVRSQTGGGDLSRFDRQSPEDEEAAVEAAHVRPARGTQESAPAVAPSPTAPRRGLWIIA